MHLHHVGGANVYSACVCVLISERRWQKGSNRPETDLTLFRESVPTSCFPSPGVVRKSLALQTTPLYLTLLELLLSSCRFRGQQGEEKAQVTGKPPEAREGPELMCLSVLACLPCKAYEGKGCTCRTAVALLGLSKYKTPQKLFAVRTRAVLPEHFAGR